MQEDKRFYVYVHRRKTDGRIFYVGKGEGNRAWVVFARNDYWKRVARKHGWSHEIIISNISDSCAFSIERAYIIRLKELGVRLCNLTDGGEGAKGYQWTDEDRQRVMVKTYCSNGMSFQSREDAVNWLVSQGHLKAHGGAINLACTGRLNNAYGYAWSNTETPPYKESTSGVSGRRVYCSNGMTFRNAKEASLWLLDNGCSRAIRHCISSACAGKLKTYKGYKWSFDDVYT